VKEGHESIVTELAEKLPVHAIEPYHSDLHIGDLQSRLPAMHGWRFESTGHHTVEASLKVSSLAGFKSFSQRLRGEATLPSRAGMKPGRRIKFLEKKLSLMRDNRHPQGEALD